VLHILTSDEIIARQGFPDRASELMAAVGARGVLHLRTRRLAGGAYVALATRLHAVARETGAMLVINGRVDVALASGAAGVQLGRGALGPDEVRAMAPDLAIGVSVHTPAEADAAGRVSWVMAGHVFETSSHAGVPGLGVDFLRTVVEAAHAPVIAVGGIMPDHVAALLAAGAHGVAAISGIWNDEEPGAAAIRYLIQYGNWRVGEHHFPHRER
jgi:thiazole tautomerase (transcriptional regulator TenI)